MPTLPIVRDSGAPFPVPINPNWVNGNVSGFCYNGEPHFIGIEAKYQQDSTIFSAGKVVLYRQPSPGFFVRLFDYDGTFFYSWTVIGKYLYLVMQRSSREPQIAIINLDTYTEVYSGTFTPLAAQLLGPRSSNSPNTSNAKLTYRQKNDGSTQETVLYISGWLVVDSNNYEPTLYSIYITNTLNLENFAVTFNTLVSDFPAYVHNASIYFSPHYNITFAVNEDFFGNSVNVIGDKLFYTISHGVGGISGWNDWVFYEADLSPTDYNEVPTLGSAHLIRSDLNINFVYQLSHINVGTSIYLTLYNQDTTVLTYRIDTDNSVTKIHDFEIRVTYPDYYYPDTGLYGLPKVYSVSDTSLIFFYTEPSFHNPTRSVTDASDQTILYHTIYRGEYSSNTLTISEYYHGYNLLYDWPALDYIIPTYLPLKLYFHSLSTVENTPVIAVTGAVWIDLGDGPAQCDVGFVIGECTPPSPNIAVADTLLMRDNIMVIRSGPTTPVHPLPPNHPDFPVNSIYCKDWKVVDNFSPLEIDPEEVWYAQ
jgi:hypothetical protein